MAPIHHLPYHLRSAAPLFLPPGLRPLRHLSGRSAGLAIISSDPTSSEPGARTLSSYILKEVNGSPCPLQIVSVRSVRQQSAVRTSLLDILLFVVARFSQILRVLLTLCMSSVLTTPSQPRAVLPDRTFRDGGYVLCLCHKPHDTTGHSKRGWCH